MQTLAMPWGKADTPAHAPWPGNGQQGLWGALQQLLRAIHSNTLLSFTRTSHHWKCGVPGPQQACERANHSGSEDRSPAHIVMEIALETVAPANIFRSTSELRNRKTPRRRGKPPSRLSALPLPPGCSGGSPGGDGIEGIPLLVRQGEGVCGGEAPCASVSKETLGAAWLSLCCTSQTCA